MATEQQGQAQAPVERKQVTISQIKQDLKDGIDRKGIAKKYGVTQSEVSQWFQNPKLKGLRVRPTPTAVLVDDEPEEEQVQAAPKAKANKAQGVTASAPAQAEATGEPVREVSSLEDDEEEAGESSSDSETATSKKGVW